MHLGGCRVCFLLCGELRCSYRLFVAFGKRRLQLRDHGLQRSDARFHFAFAAVRLGQLGLQGPRRRSCRIRIRTQPRFKFVLHLPPCRLRFLGCGTLESQVIFEPLHFAQLLLCGSPRRRELGQLGLRRGLRRLCGAPFLVQLSLGVVCHLLRLRKILLKGEACLPVSLSLLRSASLRVFQLLAQARSGGVSRIPRLMGLAQAISHGLQLPFQLRLG